MTTLVHATLAVRRSARASFALLTAGGLGLIDVLGAFRVSPSELSIEHYVIAAGWASVFAACLKKALSKGLSHCPAGQDPCPPPRLELEIGLLSLTAAHAVLQLAGGLTSQLYPALYVLLAVLCSFASVRAAVLLVGAAIGFEALLYFFTEARTDWELWALHACFLAAFGLFSAAITRVDLARIRHLSRHELREEKRRLQDEARLFRLVGAPSEQGERGKDKLFRSSVEQVHQALLYSLELLKRTMDLYSCVLLLREDAGKKLRIVELATDSDDIAEGPFAPGEGAVGGAERRGLVINLEHIRPGYGGICYYRGPAVVRSFVAVPVVENGQVCGALCADRIQDRPFTAREEAVLRDAADQAVRTLENERVVVQLERSKREQTVLHRASQALGAALDEDAVLHAGLEAAQEITAYDFAAITQYDPSTRRHSVRIAVGEGAEGFSNLSFRDNTSLTAMAVKNRHYLPYRGDFDAIRQIVYTRKANLTAMGSLLILPLLVRDRAIGTLALAAKRRNAFDASLRDTLQVLANQLAVALSNAASVALLEQQATVDGLTGCYNKRAFQEEMDLKLRAAQRFDRTMALIVTDIDHFKCVNDTYGHAVGDVVLRELGEILRRVKRETDVVGRFGGEEFCVLCEETDTAGAVLLAERVREELGRTVFQTEMGTLTVTCSLGVATYPLDGSDRQRLFDMADRAMYAAKQSGRNRVCTLSRSTH